MNTTIKHISIALTALVLAPSCDRGPRSPLPWSQDTAAPGLSLSFDAQEEVMSGVVQGMDPSISIIGRLASQGGKRAIIVVDGSDEHAVQIASWALPPVAGVDDAGTVLACWNVLSGPEPADDQPPSSTDGVSLLCAHREGGSWSESVLVAGQTDPTWLQNIEVVSESNFRITYYVDPAGTLVGPTSTGGGLFQRVFDGVSYSEEAPQ